MSDLPAKTSAEALRLLRLRALLDETSVLLEEAIVETTHHDAWSLGVLKARVDLAGARALVLSSLQAHKTDDDEVVK